jgi:hypothetical protein
MNTLVPSVSHVELFTCPLAGGMKKFQSRGEDWYIRLWVCFTHNEPNLNCIVRKRRGSYLARWPNIDAQILVHCHALPERLHQHKLTLNLPLIGLTSWGISRWLSINLKIVRAVATGRAHGYFISVISQHRQPSDIA